MSKMCRVTFPFLVLCCEPQTVAGVQLGASAPAGGGTPSSEGFLTPTGCQEDSEGSTGEPDSLSPRSTITDVSVDGSESSWTVSVEDSEAVRTALWNWLLSAATNETELAQLHTAGAIAARNDGKCPEVRTSDIFDFDMLRAIAQSMRLDEFAEQWSIVDVDGTKPWSIASWDACEWWGRFVSSAAANPALGSKFADFLQPQPDSGTAARAMLHYTLVLDAFVMLFRENDGWQPLAQAIQVLKKERRAPWKKDSVYGNMTAFENIKIASVEPFIQCAYATCGKDETKDDSQRPGEKVHWRTQDLNWVLRLNCLEAAAAGQKVSPENSEAGMILTTQAERGWTREEEYQDLYEAWNMNFVSGEFAAAPLFWAKLLAPNVANIPDPSHYMSHRATALYLHWHTIAFLRQDVQKGAKPENMFQQAYTAMTNTRWHEHLRTKVRAHGQVVLGYAQWLRKRRSVNGADEHRLWRLLGNGFGAGLAQSGPRAGLISPMFKSPPAGIYPTTSELSELRAGGYKAAGLKVTGATAKELDRAGFSLEELQSAGFTKEELTQAGYDADAYWQQSIADRLNGQLNAVEQPQ